MLWVINKPKATQSAFAIATFDGIKALKAKDTNLTPKKKSNKQHGRNVADTDVADLLSG